MITSTLFCLICFSATIVLVNTTGSQHLNISPKKNETDENFVSQQKSSGSEVRSDYLNQVCTINTIEMKFDRGYLFSQH